MNHAKFKIPMFFMMASFAVLASQSIIAEGFEMSVVLDRAHGHLVQQGNYEAAIRKIPHDQRLPFAANNNLCVAQTMKGLIDQAVISCNAAVHLAEFASENGHRRGRDYLTELAIALSNRGVLRAKTGDSRGATEDFSRAVELNSRSGIPVRNLSHLKNGNSTELAKS